MNINATLLGQTIMFAMFVWFCMKFVWPPIIAALDARKKLIADGLAAGERGKHDLELAAKRSAEVLREAKEKAAEIISQGDKRASEIVEEAKAKAEVEAGNIRARANSEIEQEVFRAREQLRTQVSAIALAGAGKILSREIDAKAHNELLEKLVAEI
ncbi:MAG: F-type H+-transporting ATPase subunit b [Gallionellaceae bacterium]|nr:MAG: F-type H+-transporting ATPase subunit b [Gallionellaceae bacterium]